MTDYIGYEALMQAAMRGVIREALRSGEANCQLPGSHHFYISFRTRAPGVEVADFLAEQFPEDMTIVVQHQFWDLEVHDGHFEIVLKFSGVPQHLRIPFAAITRFHDPSMNFGLSFDSDRAANSGGDSIVAPALEQAHAKPAASGDPATVVNLDSFRRK